LARRSRPTRRQHCVLALIGPTTPWNADDRKWFERNRRRAHRIRLPFPGEDDGEVENTSAGHIMLMFVRQTEPGTRLKFNFCFCMRFPPPLDTEAAAHALFKVAAQREPIPRDWQALKALIKKYEASQ
jgi:hypothetical protein